MTYDELLELARRYEGETLETVTGRKFTVGIYLDCPFFTPASTGNGQSDGRKAAERFLALYNATGSLRPGDYARVTRNASYYVGLLRQRWQGPRPRQPRTGGRRGTARAEQAGYHRCATSITSLELPPGPSRAKTRNGRRARTPRPIVE